MSYNWSRRACVCQTWWRTKRSWPLFSPTFFFFFHFSFFFSAFYFSPTSGNLPCVKICLPQYFGVTRRYMQKNIFFLGNFFSPQTKGHFRAIFRDGQRSVAEPGPTPSPWHIKRNFKVQNHESCLTSRTPFQNSIILLDLSKAVLLFPGVNLT